VGKEETIWTCQRFLARLILSALKTPYLENQEAEKAIQGVDRSEAQIIND
jgi:hypothetical protein